MTGLVSKVAQYVARGVSAVSDVVDAGGSDLMNFVGTGLNLATASSQLFAARRQADAQVIQSGYEADALQMQAADQELEADREKLRGRQEANQLMDELRQTLAAQSVSFAANGVDISFGTPRSVARSTQRLSELQLSTSRSDALMRAIARRRQASVLRQESINVRARGGNEAAITRDTGRINAMGTVADLVQRRIERG